MDTFGQNLGSNAITALVVALGYAGVKLFRRSKCATHTQCCDFEVARGQPTERELPDIDPGVDLEMVVLRVLENVQANVQKKEPSEPSVASQAEPELPR